MSTSGLEDVAVFYFPLRGLEVEDEPAMIAGVMLLEPTYEDWRTIEKTDVADQLLPAAMAEQLGAGPGWIQVTRGERTTIEFAPPDGMRPPLCLATHIDWRPEHDDLSDALAALPEVEAAVTDVLLGLRLLKDGLFQDFEYVGRYIWTPPWRSSRLPGPYRQSNVTFPEGACYTLRSDELPSVEALALVCRRYRELGVDSAGAVAVESFRHAHGLHITDVDRLTFLFIALEALFGSYYERDRFGRVPLAARAATATAGLASDVDTYLEREGRSIRNAVAHGTAAGSEQPLDVHAALVRAIVRAGLQRYMTFAGHSAEHESEIQSLVGPRTAGSRMRSFNELLARSIEGDVQAHRLAGLPT